MKKLSLFIGVVLASFYSTSLVAQNPIICDRYTPDPAPYVHGDTLYLFVDHDEDETLNNYFTMKDWLLYSTVDMVNWTYRGTPLIRARLTLALVWLWPTTLPVLIKTPSINLWLKDGSRLTLRYSLTTTIKHTFIMATITCGM